jgi:hypothetical protein
MTVTLSDEGLDVFDQYDLTNLEKFDCIEYGGVRCMGTAHVDL